MHELGLDRLPDAQIVEKARSEGYIVLTHDLDFGELLALSGADLPSVVIFRLQSMRPSNVNHYLQVMITEHRAALSQLPRPKGRGLSVDSAAVGEVLTLWRQRPGLQG